MRATVFFDRDGVVNELVPDPVSGLPESPLAPEQVALIPGAAEALRLLHDEGWVLVGTSNQPAAAKGIVPLEQLMRVQERVLELLREVEVQPDAFRICFHHPEGIVPRLAGGCDCRKPSPEMLLGAAAELGLDLHASWMVGDTDSDIAAGAAAGCRTIMIENPDSAHKRRGDARPDATAASLRAAHELLSLSEKVTVPPC